MVLYCSFRCFLVRKRKIYFIAALLSAGQGSGLGLGVLLLVSREEAAP